MTDRNARGNETAASLLAMGRLGRARPRRVDGVARRSQAIGVLAALAGLAAFFAWASSAEFDQVTRAPGSVVVARQTQTIQHLEGGIIAAILIAEGDRVSEGDPLLRITDSRWIADRAQALLELSARQATQARLMAEASGADAIDFPETLSDSAAAQAEAALFDERRQGLTAQLDVLREQSRRLILELAELQTRRTSIQAERALVAEQAEILSSLVTRGAVSRSEQLATLIELQRIDERLSDLAFQIPQRQARLDETRGRLREVESSFRTEARGSLADLELEIATLEEEVARFDDRDARALVRSPVSGVVNRLLVSTVGGVVREGQLIAEIVPDSDEIIVDARLSPEDRGSVWPGMSAVVKVTAYDFGIYGGVDAEVVEISPDALRDEEGRAYFRVRLSAAADALGADQPILPGMSVDVDLISGSRTFLAYMLSPIREIGERAFQE